MTVQMSVMISTEEIQAKVKELGAQIDAHYANSDKELVLIGLLRGSVIFMADLCRSISKPHELDFMTVSSYGGGTVSSRDVKILKDLDGEIRGKDVLVIEDIIDSGNTLSKVLEMLWLRLRPKVPSFAIYWGNWSLRAIDKRVAEGHFFLFLS